MASVNFEGSLSDEAVSDGEVTETQPYIERIVTDTSVFQFRTILSTWTMGWYRIGIGDRDR
jgi:hypothetical protein